MSYSKVLITGATGFIGSRLCEKFALQYRLPYRALVHNFNKAPRIARLNTEMVPGDVANAASLSAALAGCDAVVHLAYSEKSVHDTGTLLAACRRANIKRLVHISSMSVHGPNPKAECAHEATATIGHYNHPYSDAKAEAEKLVQKAIRGNGLAGVILRPTVVYGPYSPFVDSVVQSACSGMISLIDDGKGICNAVFVDDVCDAILAALHSDRALGEALFINSDRATDWRTFNLTFANMVEPPPEVFNFLAREVREHWAARKTSNLPALRRLLVSPDFHRQLGTVPVLQSAITWCKETLKKVLSAGQVVALKSIRGRPSIPAHGPAWPALGRLTREDFHVEFSNERAKKLLDWKPAYDFAKGSALTKTWLEFAGMLSRLK